MKTKNQNTFFWGKNFFSLTCCLNCLANKSEETNDLTTGMAGNDSLKNRMNCVSKSVNITSLSTPAPNNIVTEDESSGQLYNQRDRLIFLVDKFIRVANVGILCECLYLTESYKRSTFLFQIHRDLKGFNLTINSNALDKPNLEYPKNVMFNMIQGIYTGEEFLGSPRYFSLMRQKEMRKVLRDDIDKLVIMEFLDEENCLQRLFLIFSSSIDKPQGNETCADLFSVIFKIVLILNTIDKTS